MELQLWSTPVFPGKLAMYNGRTVVEMINQAPDVLLWCVKKLNWQLSSDAKDLLADKQKRPTYKPTRSTTKHFFR